MNVYKIECPSCGASMLFEKGRTSFCPYCGNQVLLDDNTIRVEVTKNDTFSYRDEARLRELELREQARLREEKLREQARLKEEAELEALRIKKKKAWRRFWFACGVYVLFLPSGLLFADSDISLGLYLLGVFILPFIASLLFPFSFFDVFSANNDSLLFRLLSIGIMYLAVLFGGELSLLLIAKIISVFIA